MSYAADLPPSFRVRPVRAFGCDQHVITVIRAWLYFQTRCERRMRTSNENVRCVNFGSNTKLNSSGEEKEGEPRQVVPRNSDAPHPFVSGGTGKRWGGGRVYYVAEYLILCYRNSICKPFSIVNLVRCIRGIRRSSLPTTRLLLRSTRNEGVGVVTRRRILPSTADLLDIFTPPVVVHLSATPNPPEHSLAFSPVFLFSHSPTLSYTRRPIPRPCFALDPPLFRLQLLLPRVECPYFTDIPT